MDDWKRQKGIGKTRNSSSMVAKKYTMPAAAAEQLKKVAHSFGSQGRAIQVATEILDRMSKIPTGERGLQTMEEFRRSSKIWFAAVRATKKLRFVKKISPRHIGKLASFLIPKRSREHILGDLEEEYQTVVLPERGPWSAWCWYLRQVGWMVAAYIWKSAIRANAIEKILGMIRGSISN